jgi:16S rRNA (cytidine1402-2'-O)-methyltransferase
MVARGALVLVGTPIGNLGDLSPRALAALAAADVVACEDTRRTRRLLSAAGLTGRHLLAVHGHNEAAMVAPVLERLDRGERVALVSDSGMPGLSDPGERLVQAAAAGGFDVEVVPGPSAAVTAVVASGLSSARWCFEGFLPRKGAARAARLAELSTEQRTFVVYEAPPRVAVTLSDLAGACGGERRAAVARELTKVFEETWRGTLAQAAARAADPKRPPPRGEHVIVVEGAAPPIAASDAEITDRLLACLSAGSGRKDAVADVATALGLPRRRVYDLALSLPRR